MNPIRPFLSSPEGWSLNIFLFFLFGHQFCCCFFASFFSWPRVSLCLFCPFLFFSERGAGRRWVTESGTWGPNPGKLGARNVGDQKFSVFFFGANFVLSSLSLSLSQGSSWNCGRVSRPWSTHNSPFDVLWDTDHKKNCSLTSSFAPGLFCLSTCATCVSTSQMATRLTS